LHAHTYALLPSKAHTYTHTSVVGENSLSIKFYSKLNLHPLNSGA